MKLHGFLFVLGALSLCIHLWGVRISRRHFRESPVSPDTPYGLIPISILKPLKGTDSGLRENLKSFFELDYPSFELIFSVASPFDPAVAVVESVQAQFPQIPSRLLVGEIPHGLNPKVNNLLRSYEGARHDWVLISDSNVRVDRDYLKRMASQITSDTGVISSVVRGDGGEGLGGHLEEVFLNSYYARGMIMAAWAGRPCVVGKSMLFRRSAAERFGGLLALGNYLAEDFMAGEAMRQLGLKVVPAWDPVPQYIGAYSLQAFWSRHLRWGRIRKAQAPLVFWFEPLTYPTSFIPMILWAVADLGLSPEWIGVLLLALLLASDLTLIRAMRARTGVKTALAWVLRECLALPLWIGIARGNQVEWRGNVYRLCIGGTMVPVVRK